MPPLADGALPAGPPDWEAFYRDYRKPGYVAGFEITTKLGGGMSGLVFRARKQSIGKDYAIKFLQVDDIEVRRAVLLELEQVQYFAQIDHPNLVSIEDRGEVDGIPFLVMSFAGTETLRDRIHSDGTVPAAAERDELLRYFLQCCRGLSALHERSLVHFDIKPANVFLKGAVARLGDYGLSKLVTHSRGSLSMGRGTPYYMAPELLQRRGDHRSDVYSLGVMLYEILCGKVPFTGDSEWEVLRRHETAAPELPQHLSALERAVLLRCLAKDPAERYQSVHDLIAAFGAQAGVGAAGPVAATAPPSPPRNGPPPLPKVLPPRVPEASRPRRARRRAGSPLPLVLVVALLAFAGFVLLMMPARARLSPAQEAIRISPRVVVAGDLASQVDAFAASVQRSAREAMQRQRSARLQPLDAEALHVPEDFGLYRQQLDGLAGSPTFSSGHARKLEQYGRPAFLAAIAMLQELDYRDQDACHRAANLFGFLGQVLAFDGLGVDASDCEPTPAETSRFQALADGWRRFAETFAHDDESFRELLVARGRQTTEAYR